MFKIISLKSIKPHWGLCGMFIALAIIKTQAFDLRSYPSKSLDNFPNQFPFEEYLQTNDFANLKKLSADAQFLDQQGLPGDKFLYELTQHYIQQNPLHDKDLTLYTKRFTLADSFLKANELPIFEMIAQVLMEDLALTLDRGLKSAQIDKNQPELQNLVKSLAAHRFIVNVPMSDFEKLEYHLAQGNWTYILDRVSKEFFWGSYWLLGIFCCGMILGLFYIRKIISWTFQLPQLFYSKN